MIRLKDYIIKEADDLDLGLGGDTDSGSDDAGDEKDKEDSSDDTEDDDKSDKDDDDAALGTKGKKEKDKKTERGNIKFTIWETPDKKVKWLNNNEKYQKIEYKYEDKKEGIQIDFLLGFQEKSWKLWIGKIGACSYDDDPYCSFETDKFGKAIVACLDKVEEFLGKVKEEPSNYVQFYVTM